VIAENEINGSLLGISWDGTGYGTDGTIWGGEFFIINNDGYKRAAHLKSFHLPGGESSLKDIHKISFGLLYEIFGKDINKYLAEDLKQDNDEILLKMLIKNINSPVCSSAGRLFDAVASILDIRQKVNFEGQAAMELEFLTDGIISELSYNFEIYKDENEIYVIDWTKMIIQLLDDKLNRIKSNLISVKFHNTLVNMIVEIAKLFNEKIIALSGGCFQNKYLLENSVKKLQELGFKVYWNKEVPANDGGISLGQIAYYSYFKKTNS
jgi:hydrogenase maturation protein HypF